MVLESLINPFKAEKSPWKLFFLGMVYSSIGMFLGLWIFKQYASMLLVFFTVMASIPLVFSILKIEEQKDCEINNEKTLLKEHSKAIFSFLFLFLGITLALAFWYVILPTNLTGTIFSSQMQTIAGINNQVSAKSVDFLGTYYKILLNNIKVLLFAILFSLIYGFGAIFILVWNASVIGTAIGNFIRSGIANYSHLMGLDKISNYFQITSLGILRYSLHGIPEITSYFIGAMAGGILSIAIVNHDWKTKKFENIIFDTSELIVLALALLLVAAFIEVFVTPMFF